jgi:hypothetical protein
MRALVRADARYERLRACVRARARASHGCVRVRVPARHWCVVRVRERDLLLLDRLQLRLQLLHRRSAASRAPVAWDGLRRRIMPTAQAYGLCVPTAYAAGMRRRWHPSAWTVGIRRRRATSICHVGMHRRHAPPAQGTQQ